MSRATKRKHVFKEILEDDFSPPTADQQIVKVVASRGNNLHEVESADGSTFLVSMPTKFRKNIWVKRGDFILIEPILEGDKVKGEMIRVLTQEHIKHFKKCDVWPSAFKKNDKSENNTDDDLFVNPNRPAVCDTDSSDESASETDSNESSEDE